MNKTEAAYAALLETRRLANEVLWFMFEGLSFKIGEGARYTPDFVVMLPDGEIELHEVKGFWREAARVRIKTASMLFPFHFLAIKKRGRNWEIERFK